MNSTTKDRVSAVEAAALRSKSMSLIRIVIVDDHEVARRGIRTVLTFNPEIQVIAEIADGESAVRAIHDLHPDIILLDISLPGMSGIEAASALRQNSPSSRIIFVSQHDSKVLAKDAIRAGAAGYVVKSDVGRDLLLAIEAVQGGRTFLSRTVNGVGAA